MYKSKVSGIRKLGTTLTAFLLSSLIGQAALTMTFNTATEQLSIGGSQSVPGGTNIYFWQLAGSTGSPTDIIVTAGLSAGSGNLYMYSDGLFLVLNGGGSLTGNGASIDYSSATAAQKSFVALQNGSTLTSISSLSDINITVVPEPSQYAAPCGAALLVFGVLKRRKDKMGGLGKLSCESSTNIG